jgi:dienelactone hydrolase
MKHAMRFPLSSFALFLLTIPAAAAERFTGPWKMAELKQTPVSSVSTLDPGSNISEVSYENVPLGGKPTRVFAYYAVPRKGQGPFPAMVLVHGGGGKAFREWATLWADRGYVAIAMDLSGRGPDGKRLADGGPEQSDEEKFRDFAPKEADRMWTYHSVAAAVRAHSFLASRPEVDKGRIGVTGISWGGYLTCIIAGIDDRVKVAVPVYGCGFLDENSVWLEPRLRKMGTARARQWADLFDPSRYLPGVTCPILFVNGTNDFAYPLDSYQKSYQLVKVPTDLCVTVRMPHGHSEGWRPKEIGLFVDSVLKQGTPPPRLAMPEVDGERVSARVTTRQAFHEARLHVTTDAGPWQARIWTSRDARIDDDCVSAQLPAPRPIVAFFTVEDERGAVSSSPHVTVGK